MTIEYKVKPLEKFSIVQTEEDRRLVESHIKTNNSLSCAECGSESIVFEVIVKTTATIRPNGEVEEIDDNDVLLIKPVSCAHCHASNFMKIFTAPSTKKFAENKDFYGQRVF